MLGRRSDTGGALAPTTPPATTDLETALRTTGAIRNFTGATIARDRLRRILDVARFAPSGGNMQAWRVVVVEDRSIRSALGALLVDGAKEYVALMRAGQRPFGLVANGRWPGPGDVDLAAARAEPLGMPMFDQLADAPALLAVLVELGKVAAMDAELDRHGLVAGASIYPFCQDILLAARLEGLGGVITTFAVRREPDALAALGAPRGWALAAVIALGEPVHQPTRLRRKPVEEFAALDTFDGTPL
jgi:nitroreductase